MTSSDVTPASADPSSRPRSWARLPGWLAVLAVVGLLSLLTLRVLLPRPVPAVQAAPRALQMALRGAGELQARRQTLLGGASTRTVLAVLAEAGQTVRRGQALLQLEAADLPAQLDAAHAGAAAAALGADIAERTRQRSRVLQQRAELDARRADSLWRQAPDAIAATELDATISAARAALLEADAADLQAQAARLDHRQAVAGVAAARARLDALTLRAPFDGLITARTCSAGDTTGPGQACLTVVDPDSLRVRARFDESALAALRAGDGARVLLRSAPDRSIRATIEQVLRAVDTDTREFSVDLRLERLPPAWALGERATVTLDARPRPVALALPLDRLDQRDGRRGVWVEEAGRARWRALRLGLADAHAVEVLDGLRGDERVLRPGDVRPGWPVRTELRPW